MVDDTTLSRVEFLKKDNQSVKEFIIEETFTIAIHDTLIAAYPFDSIHLLLFLSFSFLSFNLFLNLYYSIINCY